MASPSPVGDPEEPRPPSNAPPGDPHPPAEQGARPAGPLAEGRLSRVHGWAQCGRLIPPLRWSGCLAAAFACGIKPSRNRTRLRTGPRPTWRGDGQSWRSAAPAGDTSKICLVGPDRKAASSFAGRLRRLWVERLDNLAREASPAPSISTGLEGGQGAARTGRSAKGLVANWAFSAIGSSGLNRSGPGSGLRFGFAAFILHLFDSERLPLPPGPRRRPW